jgi:hypothetical protein
VALGGADAVLPSALTMPQLQPGEVAVGLGVLALFLPLMVEGEGGTIREDFSVRKLY